MPQHHDHYLICPNALRMSRDECEWCARVDRKRAAIRKRRDELGESVVMDTPRRWKGKSYSCHLACRSMGKLLRFAVSIGCQRDWLQRRPYPHFDLFGSRIQAAREKGATQVDSRDLLIIAKECK